MTHKERFENLGIAPPKGNTNVCCYTRSKPAIYLSPLVESALKLYLYFVFLYFEAGKCIENLVCNRRVTDLIHSVTLNVHNKTSIK